MRKRRDGDGSLGRLVGWGAREVRCGAVPSAVRGVDELVGTHDYESGVRASARSSASCFWQVGVWRTWAWSCPVRCVNAWKVFA